MANSVNIDSKLLISGTPGKPGDVIQSLGETTPVWTPISDLISKVSQKRKPGEKEPDKDKPGLAGAAKEEITERTKGILAEAFPLLTTGPYKRALQSIPGVGLATSIVKRSGVFRDTSLPSFGGMFGGKKEEEKQKQEKIKQEENDAEILSQGSLPVMEIILDEVVKIREALQGGTGKGTGRMQAVDTRPASTAPGISGAPTGPGAQAGPELKEGYTFEPAKGKGTGGFKSIKTGRYVRQAEAVKKPPVTTAAGAAGKAGGKAAGGVARATGGVARAGAAVGRGAPGMAANVGRGAAAVAGGAGGLVGGLKIGAILLALSMFLPKDIKSVIGSIFEGILQGLGFDQDTIEAIFTPFRILSDIAELIKSVLGAVWDGVKWIWEKIGEIINWFTGRKNADAAAEASRATGGTGYGEFTTGGEGAAETTPIPSEAPAAPPPKETRGATEGGAVVPPSAAGGAPAARVSVPAAAPTATRTPVPISPPAPAIAAAPPPVMLPERKLEPTEKEKSVEDFLNRPENEVKKIQLDSLNRQIVRYEGEIDATKKMLGSATTSDQKRQLQAVLAQQERGLENVQDQKTNLLESIAKDAGIDTAGGAPAAPPPSPLPSDGTVGGEAGAGAGAAGAGGEAGAGGGGGGGGGGGELPSTPPPEGGGAPAGLAQPMSMEPSTGEELNKESMAVDAARDEPMPDTSMNFVSDGEIAAGNVSENPGAVPPVDAPREDLDTDIFFAAAA